jgi:hypothetical protein
VASPNSMIFFNSAYDDPYLLKFASNGRLTDGQFPKLTQLVTALGPEGNKVAGMAGHTLLCGEYCP